VGIGDFRGRDVVRCRGVQDVALKKGMFSRVPIVRLFWGAGHMVVWLVAKHESHF